jgi:hypothetical protein
MNNQIINIIAIISLNWSFYGGGDVRIRFFCFIVSKDFMWVECKLIYAMLLI